MPQGKRNTVMNGVHSKITSLCGSMAILDLINRQRKNGRYFGQMHVGSP
jgi:hypothetical protein